MTQTIEPVEPAAAARRAVLHKIGTVLAYIYLIRVPLGICLFLLALPYLALPRNAAAGSLLRGLFDVGDPDLGRYVWANTFGVLTVTALLLAATIAITARLILLDAHDRFEVDALPKSPGIQLVVRLVPGVAAAGVVVGAWIQSRHVVGAIAPAIGIAVGILVFVVLMTAVHDRL